MAEVIYEKNEIKNTWIQIEERDGESITVTSQTFDVIAADDTVIQASGNASVVNNNTALVRIFGLIDTTVAGFVDGTTYKVRFTIVIGAETYKRNVPMRVGEQRL